MNAGFVTVSLQCYSTVVDYFCDFFFPHIFSNTSQKLQVEAVETREDKGLSSAGRRVYPESRKT